MGKILSIIGTSLVLTLAALLCTLVHAKSYAHSHGMLRQRAGYALYEL